MYTDKFGRTQASEFLFLYIRGTEANLKMVPIYRVPISRLRTVLLSQSSLVPDSSLQPTAESPFARVCGNSEGSDPTLRNPTDSFHSKRRLTHSELRLVLKNLKHINIHIRSRIVDRVSKHRLSR